MLKDEELRKLKELVEKAKPFIVIGEERTTWETMSEEDRERATFNQKFFVTAHSAIPQLIDELLAYRNPQKKIPGIELILTERRRQINQEGFLAAYDDQWEKSELVNAAYSYMSVANPLGTDETELREYQRQHPPHLWPWPLDRWNPKDRLSNLVRAGALLVAEVDRLSRMIERIAAQIDNLER